MNHQDIMQIQDALRTKGFDPGPVDGIIGRRTINAIRAFQASRGLIVDGIPGPNTQRVLGLHEFIQTADPPWLVIAKSKLGFIEGEKRLADFLKSDKSSVGDPAKIPWCGDYAETCIALALPNESLPANPYWAMNWVKFGVDALGPKLGAIAVFERPGGGHVGFVVGHDKDYVHVLGGNQNNRVSITKVAKAGRTHLLAYRYPKSQPLPSADLPFTTLTATINATLA